MDKLLTVDEVADMLSISPKTAYQWAELGQIPCVRLGRRCLRFDPSDILSMIKERKKSRGAGYNDNAQVRGPRKKGGN